jgi:deoxyribonuclease V
MKARALHRWDLGPREAAAEQKRLKERYFRETPLDIDAVEMVAGADAAYLPAANKVLAVATVFDLEMMRLIESTHAVVEASFPYVPGLLSWREGPAVVAAFAKLKNDPQAIIFDGQGIAHPRRFGIASHMGVLFDRPTVGAAKTRLVGAYREPGPAKGSVSALTDNSEEIGRVVRTRGGVQPLFVSVGQAISLDDAVRLVLRCTRGFRLPEPTRQAHLAANRLKTEVRSTPVSRTP